MYKMVLKLAQPYLCDLCPDFVFDSLVVIPVPLTISVYPTLVLTGTKSRFPFHQLRGNVH